MSLYDSQPENIILENDTDSPTSSGRVQSFSEITVGGGTEVIVMNKEGSKFGGRTFDSAPAYIKIDGTFKFKDADGNTILDETGLGIDAVSNLLNIQGWAFSGTFSATDADTVAWSAGTITLADGTTFSIDAGNTGNISAITYVYFDKAVSLTVLQTTTTAGTAVGANKILVAVAKNETGKNATFQAFGGKGLGVLITADNIAANTITANEIAANTITANQISTAIISAGKITTDYLTADNIQAGTLTGRTIRTSAPAGGVGRSIVITGGNDQNISLYYDADLRGYISGYTTEGSEITYIQLVAASGRYIKLKNSFIEFNGNLISADPGNNTIGSYGTKWRWGYFQDVYVDNGANGDYYVATSSGGSPTKKLNIEHGIVYDR